MLKQVLTCREIASNAAATAERMTEFIYKFEPIYIQRSITQAI